MAMVLFSDMAFACGLPQGCLYFSRHVRCIVSPVAFVKARLHGARSK